MKSNQSCKFFRDLKGQMNCNFQTTVRRGYPLFKHNSLVVLKPDNNLHKNKTLHGGALLLRTIESLKNEDRERDKFENINY